MDNDINLLFMEEIICDRNFTPIIIDVVNLSFVIHSKSVSSMFFLCILKIVKLDIKINAVIEQISIAENNL